MCFYWPESQSKDAERRRGRAAFNSWQQLKAQSRRSDALSGAAAAASPLSDCLRLEIIYNAPRHPGTTLKTSKITSDCIRHVT